MGTELSIAALSRTVPEDDRERISGLRRWSWAWLKCHGVAGVIQAQMLRQEDVPRPVSDPPVLFSSPAPRHTMVLRSTHGTHSTGGETLGRRTSRSSPTDLGGKTSLRTDPCDGRGESCAPTHIMSAPSRRTLPQHSFHNGALGGDAHVQSYRCPAATGAHADSVHRSATCSQQSAAVSVTCYDLDPQRPYPRLTVMMQNTDPSHVGWATHL